jgi:signal transduction histidine kinase
MDIFIIIPALITAIVCCVLTVLLCRRYIRKTFDALDAVLDGILARDTGTIEDMLEQPAPDAWASSSRSERPAPDAWASSSRSERPAPFDSVKAINESRISKLTHKARCVTGILVSEAAQTSAEKETIQSFISDMSHQMKTPLSGISMYTDLLLEGTLTADERQEFYARIKSGTEKLQWMMDSLIKMSRLEIGAVQLSPARESIQQTVSDAVGSVTGPAAQKNIHIFVSDFEDMRLYHDRKWSREALANIIENAVKYSEPGGGIEITAEPMAIYTKITVTDHGIGIDKSDWNMIYKRFYRGQNAKDREGAGLGLFLASLIMEKQGGYIMVDSTGGAGGRMLDQADRYTAFSLYFLNDEAKINVL